MGIFDLRDMQKSVAREHRAMQDSVARNQRNMQKSVAKEQRDMQRSIAKNLKLSISKEGRVRVNAKTRHKVEAKCHNKCHYPKCSITLKSELLHIHHINMKNNDNKVSNLELLCPTHHYLKHKKAFRRTTTTYNVIRGVQTRTRLVKKKPKVITKRRRSKSKRKSVFGSFSYKAPKLDFKF